MRLPKNILRWNECAVLYLWRFIIKNVGFLSFTKGMLSGRVWQHNELFLCKTKENKGKPTFLMIKRHRQRTAHSFHLKMFLGSLMIVISKKIPFKIKYRYPRQMMNSASISWGVVTDLFMRHLCGVTWFYAVFMWFYDVVLGGFMRLLGEFMRVLGGFRRVYAVLCGV